MEMKFPINMKIFSISCRSHLLQVCLKRKLLEGKERFMFVLARPHHRKIVTAAGRRSLALIIVAIAITTIVTVIVEVPWDTIIMMQPFFDLGGILWERASVLVTGILLLLIARALARGKRQAWWLALGLLISSFLGAVVSKSDRGTILLALTLLVFLLVLAPLFPTRSDARALVRGYITLALGVSIIVGQIAVNHVWITGDQGVLALRNVVLFALHLLTFFVLGYGVIEVLRPVRSSRSHLCQERARVNEVVRRYGKLATSHFALARDKSYFWSETGRTTLAYRVVNGTALALGDPIGPEEEHKLLLQAFLTFCQRQDWHVAWYQASEYTRRLGQEQGLHSFKVGEEAIIDVGSFTLQGKRGAPVRHAVTRAGREGLSAHCWQAESIPEAVFAGMLHISTEWLAKRNAKTQMGFSMGRFPSDWSQELLTVVALDAEGHTQAFLTWTPLYAGNGWALDIMRRGEKAPPGAMEFLIACSIEWARAHGYAKMSLGLAPLAGLGGEALTATRAATGCEQRVKATSRFERSAAFLHRRGIVLDTYRSLYAFKAKFQPAWEPRYLIVSEGQALPRILLALAWVHGTGWRSMLHEAWEHTMMKSVARLLRPRQSIEEHQYEEKKSHIESQPLRCIVEQSGENYANGASLTIQNTGSTESPIEADRWNRFEPRNQAATQSK
jgi:phosphatidylglycerol lysyltransferase